jgi:hypothetical protein
MPAGGNDDSEIRQHGSCASGAEAWWAITRLVVVGLKECQWEMECRQRKKLADCG